MTSLAPASWGRLRLENLPRAEALFGAGVLAFVLVLVFSPLDYYPTTQLDRGVLLLVFASVLFVGGAALPSFYRAPSIRVPVNEARAARLVERLFLVSLGMGALAAGLRVADRFVLRDAPLTFNPNEARAVLEASSPTFLGVIAAPLLGLCYAPLFLQCWRPQGNLKGAAAALLFMFPVADSLYAASRIQLLVGTLLLLQFLLVTGRLRLHWKSGIATAGLLGGLTYGLYAVFRHRGGLAPVESIYGSVYARQVQPAAIVSRLLIDFPVFSAPLVLAVHLMQYAVHGFFEFAALAATSNPSFRPTLGLTTAPYLAPLVQASARTFRLDSTPLQGFYSTFWGPLYVDFLVWMLPLSLVWGVAVGFSRRVASVRPSFLPLVAYLNIIVLAMPFVNLLTGGLGFFMISGLILFGIAGRRIVLPPRGDLRAIQ